ncbi:MAG: hypothetical protein E7408_01230 [Ruminococcaceae bacterium]|nr:hypothetical protein [Oscillospiraceae bacterium]
MYNIKLNSYTPQPNPATSDRIVAAHYYPAWKKGAAGLHEGFDDLAEDFPDRTPLMGYYDEENPEVCDWEIKWAVEHGINCFIYCWYRMPENVGKPVTVKDLRCGHGLHEALFNAKFQKFMKFAIMFEADPRWGGTDETDIVENLMPFWMENYFKRENYLIIDNKPVIFVYQQRRLENECFKSVQSQRESFDACREYAKRFGFDGLIFAVCNAGADKKAHDELMERGYDFRFGYNSGYNSPCDFYSDEDAIINGQCKIFQNNLSIDNTAFIPTPACFQDPTPRFTKRWNDLGYRYRQWSNIWYLSPEKYKELLKKLKEITDTLPEDAWARKIMMIDNWNEWDEGHFVAPSHKFGFKYLQAIREVLTECNNLPDYILPHDQGFDGYNKSWKTPDFSDVCEKKLKEKIIKINKNIATY